MASSTVSSSSSYLMKNLNACLSDRGEIVKKFKWEDRWAAKTKRAFNRIRGW